MILVDLGLNLSLLVALALLSAQLSRWQEPERALGRDLLQGALFGAAAIVGMSYPLVLAPGLIFDGRSVLLALCGLFWGARPGGLAVLMVIGWRLGIGGDGALTGSLVALFSLVCGLAWRRGRDLLGSPPEWAELVGFGLVVHLGMLGLMLTLPEGKGWQVILRIGPTVLLLYPLATVVAGRVLTDQVREVLVAEELRRAEAELRVLLESLGEAVLSLDGEGRVVYGNPAAESLLGCPPAEMVSRPLSEVCEIRFEDGRGDVLERLRGDREEGSVVRAGRLLLRSPHREDPVPITCSLAPKRGGGGEVLVLQDQTRLREQENRLLHSQRLEHLGQLAGGVVHDFNNLLGVIEGYAELALLDVPPDSSARSDLQEVIRTSRRLSRISRQLLAFTRREASSPECLDLDELVEGATKMLRRLIGEDIELEFAPGEGTWSILADPVQVDQILVNLCVNARDAILGGGKIRIETGNHAWSPESPGYRPGDPEGDFVRLRVEDSGQGIPGALLERVFDPFFTTKEKGKGTGLGLSTVFGIVGEAGGFLRVHSEEGRGAAFEVYLPRHGQPTEKARSSTPPLPRGEGETILLVEDEASVLELVRSQLEGLGYQVRSCASPREAPGLVEEGAVSLLLADLVMPEVGGVELAEQLATYQPDLRVLFMSGHTPDALRLRGEGLAGLDYLEKPFSRRELASRVREALDR